MPEAGVYVKGELYQTIEKVLKESVTDKLETLTKQDDFIKKMIEIINEYQLKKG